ncbi:hypothetical protein RhiJN_22116 [Ceratobasidium sp. AG-Ba]|nr:hypothetical protein RhiJN_22116 [Ceratobasidium sp. AG-Ba]
MSASRTLALRSAARTQLRAVPRTRVPGPRFNSTQAGNTTFNQSHLVSGVAGGGAVLLGAYIWYQFSGIKTVVQTSQRISSSITSAKNKAVESLPEPNEALQYLRRVAKSYAVFVPGASASIDATFDALDELHDQHREEFDKIINGTYNDIKKVVNERKTMNVDSALAVLGVLQHRLGEFATFAGNLSSDAISPILEKHPQLRDSLGGSWDELKSLAKKHGPEVKKLYDDTANKIISTVESQGVSASSLASIVQIVREKRDEAKRLAERGAKDAWERARRQAGPALDKMPEIRKTLDENASTLMSIGGGGLAAIGGSNVKEIWDRINQLANSKGGIDQNKVDELRRFIQEKVDQAKQGGGSMVSRFTESGGFESMVKMIPGGQKALESTPDLKELFKITQSKSGDAQKLAQETYDDILKVLKDKAEKAKRLGESAAKEAKQSS